MRRRRRARAAGEIELQSVVQGDCDARLWRSLPLRDWQDTDLGELIANAFVARRWISGIKRFKTTAGDKAGRGQQEAEPDACPNDFAALTPPLWQPLRRAQVRRCRLLQSIDPIPNPENFAAGLC